jgi:hypothetical protein
MNWSAPQRSFSRGLAVQRFAPMRAPYFGRGGAAGYRRPGAGNRPGYRPRYRSPYRLYASPYGYGGLSPWELGYPNFMGYADSGSDDSSSAQSEPAQEYPAEPPNDTADESYRPDYAVRASVTAAAVPAAEPQLTVIFRDGHTQQIRNYALTRTALIVLDDAASGRQQRISLDQINLPATQQSAQDAGLDFHPPSA